MYKLSIEQSGYNHIEFEFDNLRDLLAFMEDAMKHCSKETTFSFENTVGTGVKHNETL